MKYAEELHWILDDPKSTQRTQDEKFRKNIDFVHSLGLKCDCVGWSSLDLADSRVPEILDAIENFCKKNGWKARGLYFRRFAEKESDWYALRFSDKGLIFSGFMDAPAEGGRTARICVLNAYRDLNIVPQAINEYKLAPERFRSACMRLGIGGVDFCWAKDKGKYEAEQYFHIYPRHAVAHQGGTRGFDYSTKGLKAFDPVQKKRIRDLGGALPRLAEIFYDLRIDLPECYLRSELPGGGFSSAFIHRPECMQPFFQHILVHKDAAALLLQEKALPPSALEPVPVLDAFPPGYDVCDAGLQAPPTAAFREQMLQEYEALKKKERPVRLVTEKDALKLLRTAKKERPDDFQKALPKAKRAMLEETDYSALLPYYQIAGGGQLSDEYELLPYDRAWAENEEFYDRLLAEELLEEKPDGVVIAKCPDGDVVLLLRDGSVVRFSHEEPEIIDRWAGLPVFIVDTVQERE